MDRLQAGQSRGTYKKIPPCLAGSNSLGHDKQRKLPFKMIYTLFFCFVPVCFLRPGMAFCTTWLTSCKGPILPLFWSHWSKDELIDSTSLEECEQVVRKAKALIYWRHGNKEQFTLYHAIVPRVKQGHNYLMIVGLFWSGHSWSNQGSTQNSLPKFHSHFIQPFFFSVLFTQWVEE